MRNSNNRALGRMTRFTFIAVACLAQLHLFFVVQLHQHGSGPFPFSSRDVPIGFHDVPKRWPTLPSVPDGSSRVDQPLDICRAPGHAERTSSLISSNSIYVFIPSQGTSLRTCSAAFLLRAPFPRYPHQGRISCLVERGCKQVL